MTRIVVSCCFGETVPAGMQYVELTSAEELSSERWQLFALEYSFSGWTISDSSNLKFCKLVFLTLLSLIDVIYTLTLLYFVDAKCYAPLKS